MPSDTPEPKQPDKDKNLSQHADESASQGREATALNPGEDDCNIPKGNDTALYEASGDSVEATASAHVKPKEGPQPTEEETAPFDAVETRGKAPGNATSALAEKVHQNIHTGDNVTHNYGASPTAGSRDAELVLNMVDAKEAHLEMLPEARLFLRKLDTSSLVITSRYGALINLAGLALCRSLQEETPGAVCKTAVLNDEPGQAMLQAVSRDKPEFLVLRLMNSRFLESAWFYINDAQSMGIKMVVLVHSESLAATEKWKEQGLSIWPLHTSEQLLRACEADEATILALADRRQKGKWPSDDEDVAGLLADYIAEGGRDVVVRNLDTKQEPGSRRAQAIVDAAEKRGEESVIDRTLLFVVSHFPDASLEEFEELMEWLFGEERLSRPEVVVPVPAVLDKPAPPPIPPPLAREVWTHRRKEILKRNFLQIRESETGALQVQFQCPQWAGAVARVLDPMDVEMWLKTLHEKSLLLLPRTSKETTNRLIRATSVRFTKSPRTYNADWLVDLVKEVPKLRGLYQTLTSARIGEEADDLVSFIAALGKVHFGGRNLAGALYSRLADLCWSVMEEKPDVVSQFLDRLCVESKPRGVLALEIVSRLRRPRTTTGKSFDAWKWLGHLLATGSSDTCREVIDLLLRDAAASASAAWEMLRKVAEWLPEREIWKLSVNHSSGTSRWALGFLYDCFICNVDKHFFGDSENVPPWSERHALLADWVTHPGFAHAMEKAFELSETRPGWMRHLDVPRPVTGELCVAEMLGYWHSHSEEATTRSRVMELIVTVESRLLPQRVGTEDPVRPTRRGVWLGLCALSEAWGNCAQKVSKKDYPILQKRRNDAYTLSKRFI